jgi:ketosteroid isomerase-like protein
VKYAQAVAVCCPVPRYASGERDSGRRGCDLLRSAAVCCFQAVSTGRLAYSDSPAGFGRLFVGGILSESVSRVNVGSSSAPDVRPQGRPVADRLALRYPALLRACVAMTMLLPAFRFRNRLISVFVRRGYEAFNRGDLEAASASFASDIEFDVPEQLPDAGVVRGRWAVIDAWAKLRGDFGVRVEPPEVLRATRDAIVVRLVIRAEGPFTRIGGELRGTEVFQLRGGRIVSARNYMEESKALEAAGAQDYDQNSSHA